MHESGSLGLVVQIAISQFAAFASLLLLAAAGHKVQDRARAARALQGLTGVHHAVAAPAVLLAAAAEFIAGVGLWLAPLRFNAALLAAAVWGGYCVFLLRAVAAGRSDLDCGCSFGAGHRPLGPFQMLRAALLVLLALVVALSAAATPGSLAYEVSAASIATQLLAGVALLALYLALDQLMTLRPLRAGVQA